MTGRGLRIVFCIVLARRCRVGFEADDATDRPNACACPTGDLTSTEPLPPQLSDKVSAQNLPWPTNLLPGGPRSRLTGSDRFRPLVV